MHRPASHINLLLPLLPFWFILTLLFVTYQSSNPQFFGLYSSKYLIFLLIWFCGTVLAFAVTRKISRKITPLHFFLIRHAELLTNFTLVNVTLVLLLLGLEGFLRVTDLHGISYYPETGRYFDRMQKHDTLFYQHEPEYTDILQGVPVQINSQGLRDNFHSYLKPQNTKRVLLLGDSVTFGWGVSHEDTYDEQLEILLNEYSNFKVEVINAGVGSYNTYQEMVYLKQAGVRYDPDIVTLLYVENDIESKPPGDTIAAKNNGHFFDKVGKVWSNFKSYLTRRSYLVIYVVHFGFRPFISNAEAVSITSNYAGWLESKQSLVEIAEFCRERGIDFIVFYYRTETDGPDNLRLYRLLEEVGQMYEFPVISLYPYFQGRDMSQLINSKVDRHPNSQGHEIIARAFFEAIVSLSNEKLTKQ